MTLSAESRRFLWMLLGISGLFWKGHSGFFAGILNLSEWSLPRDTHSSFVEKVEKNPCCWEPVITSPKFDSRYWLHHTPYNKISFFFLLQSRKLNQVDRNIRIHKQITGTLVASNFTRARGGLSLRISLKKTAYYLQISTKTWIFMKIEK